MTKREREGKDYSSFLFFTTPKVGTNYAFGQSGERRESIFFFWLEYWTGITLRKGVDR
jgi:hypothetical protein